MRISGASVYLRFLAVIDTLVLLIAVVREFIIYTANIDVQEINDVSCRLHIWLAFSVTGLSAWILSALSIDRFLLVKFPAWSRSHCSKTTAFIIGVVLTCFALLINSHVLLFLNKMNIYGLINNGTSLLDSDLTDISNTTILSDIPNKAVLLHTMCMPTSTPYMMFWQSVWPGTVFVLFSLIPFVCLVTCSIMLAKEISARSRLRKKQSRRTKALTKILLGVCICFIVVSLPICVYLIAAPHIFNETSPKHVYTRMLVWAIVALILCSNNSLNFIVYCLSGEEFRKELSRLFSDLKLSVLRHVNVRVVPQRDDPTARVVPQRNDPAADNHSSTMTEQIFSVRQDRMHIEEDIEK